MTFHDVRLPEDVERGAVGGPRFKTTILLLDSGFEKRNIDWADALGQWDIGYGLMNKDGEINFATIDIIRDFFYARRGRAHTFRFKDWADFEIGDPNDPNNDHQSIGTGDGATAIFQAIKRYSSGGVDYDRDVTKIVVGTESVYVNDVLQTSPGQYSIDETTGLITFVTPPANGLDVALACEFDVHVRFDIDHLQTNMEIYNAGSVPQIDLSEVRGAV